MIFGYEPTLSSLINMGVVALASLVFVALVGMRVIKFKGRTHMKVHKYAAWVAVAIATAHGFIALAYVRGWSVFS